MLDVAAIVTNLLAEMLLGTSPAQTSARHRMVSYLRVSTPEQAERDLSLPAQRHAIDAYAASHGAEVPLH